MIQYILKFLVIFFFINCSIDKNKNKMQTVQLKRSDLQKKNVTKNQYLPQQENIILLHLFG